LGRRDCASGKASIGKIISLLDCNSAAVGIPQITTEYCAEHNWLIGSPQTVVKKIEQMYADVGGFGTLLLHTFDYADAPEQWRRSLELLGTEVLPRIAHLTGDTPRQAPQTVAAE